MDYAHTYPLVRSGGLFLSVIGTGIIVSGAVPRHRTTVIGAFGLLAAILTSVFARSLTAPLGFYR